MTDRIEAGSSQGKGKGAESFSNLNYTSQEQWEEWQGVYSLNEQPGSFGGVSSMQYPQVEGSLNRSEEGYNIPSLQIDYNVSQGQLEKLEGLVTLEDALGLSLPGDKTWASPSGLRSEMTKGSLYFMPDWQFEESKMAEMEKVKKGEREDVRSFMHMTGIEYYESLEDQEKTVKEEKQPVNVLDNMGNWKQDFADANSSAAAMVAEARAAADSMAAKAVEAAKAVDVASEEALIGRCTQKELEAARLAREEAARAAARAAGEAEFAAMSARKREKTLAVRAKEKRVERILYSSYDDYKNSQAAGERQKTLAARGVEQREQRILYSSYDDYKNSQAAGGARGAEFAAARGARERERQKTLAARLARARQKPLAARGGGEN